MCVSKLGHPKTASLGLSRTKMRRVASSYDLQSPAERGRSTADLEGLFFELLSKMETSLFIEAGAKNAETSRRVRKLLPNASIVAFEANPYTFKRFEHDNNEPGLNVQYRNVALCDKTGETTFKVRQRDDGRPSADGQASLLGRTDNSDFVEVTVAATTLDTVLREFAAEECFLWIDVEGANEIVLKGASKTLTCANAVFLEVEDKAYWKNQWLSDDVARFLFDAGLRPVARDYQSMHQHNVIFIREELLSSESYQVALERYHSIVAQS
jgi:FkbM family methyltransferase